MNRIITQGTAFKDELGRERIFNGINMVFKGEINQKTGKKNYIANWNENHFKWLNDNGFNIVRLGLIWDAVEHEMGVYDESYLDWIESMLDLCEKYGIYAFLDMHQDLYSSRFSDGAPDWATITDGLMHTEGSLWSDAYLFSDAVKRAYENFWANRKAEDGIGIQDHYVNMWIHIVKRFKNHRALFGYDFLNEPFPGEKAPVIFGALLSAYAQLTKKDLSLERLMEVFSEPELKKKFLDDIDNTDLYSAMTNTAAPLVAEFDSRILTTFYKKLTSAIRKVTENGIIFMENSYFSNMGIESGIPLLITEDGNTEPLQAYSPHGYDLVVDTEGVKNASNNRIDAIFNSHRNVQNRLGLPVLVGEWGAHQDFAEGLYHIEHILDYFDKNKWSNTYWCYFDGIENAPVMNILRRPYPQAVCGRIIKYSFDRDKNIFTLAWDESGSIAKESIIYLPGKPKCISVSHDAYTTDTSKDSESQLLHIANKNLTSRNLMIRF